MKKILITASLLILTTTAAFANSHDTVDPDIEALASDPDEDLDTGSAADAILGEPTILDTESDGDNVVGSEDTLDTSDASLDDARGGDVLSDPAALNSLNNSYDEGAIGIDEYKNELRSLYSRGQIDEEEYNDNLQQAEDSEEGFEFDGDFAPREDTSLKEATFDVSEVFRLPSGEPTDRFFEEAPEGQAQVPPIVQFILSIITFATQIIGSIAVILFIIAGFMFMISQGEEQGVTKAKEVIKYAVIGLAVTFLSYTIVIFVQTLFNR